MEDLSQAEKNKLITWVYKGISVYESRDTTKPDGPLNWMVDNFHRIYNVKG